MSVFALKVFYWCVLALAFALFGLAALNLRKSGKQLRDITELQRQAAAQLERLRSAAEAREAEVRRYAEAHRPRL